MKLVCDIYKSPREDEMYLYVKKADGLSQVPEALLEKFGKPGHVMTLILQPGKKLARVEAERVIEQLEEKGYYLQMPPLKDAEMSEIQLKNTKMQL
ncbi:YcgL domain-containing protein [Pseudomaricurvus alkylphenolicus]|jgi:uncharacterized protein YcgL (UPF0745 family)|uniref:YcgL domain-containing protein n=1 Tax=Pseudomaricurvus alkylphenolicus TaxID=1306991 RepID=UPI00141F38F9|nr:YcgL domain-containing protein [Pseudomaricurvus alkylphenolicus]NIB44429.1 YcgL domain-containing protein [Pseudomaricurvus alkylphenolicus]